MGVSSAWAYTATFRCVPALTFDNNWKNGNSCKVKLKLGDDKGDATYDMHATGLMYEKSGNLYEIYEGTASDLPYDGAKNLHFERWEGSAWQENQGQYDDWRNCTAWSGSMYYGEWGNYSYKSWNLPSDKYIYFEKPSEWTYAQFMVGHYSSSEGYVMTPLLNTKLYYVKTTQWDGYLQSAFIDANNKWGSESNSVGSRKLHADHSSDVFHYQELINTSNGYGLFTTNFKDDHSTVLSFSRENSYSILNKSQTITLQSYNLASKTYTNSSTVGSVSFSSIKMSSATSTTNSSQTITNSASADAIYTANVTLTASVNPGYKFDCWSDGNNQLGTNLTYSYNVPSTNKTVYARFSEITYSVQVKSADINQGTVSSNVNAGQFTGVTITATPKVGFSFKNWTATAGITIANPNSASTTITATKAGTVTANFEEKFTTIYLEPTGYWNSHNPQYVAHVWKNSVNEDIIMTGVGDSPYRYYKAEVPYGYTDVVFYRKSTDGTTIWNQTADLQLPTNDNVLYTITSTGTNNSGQQDYQAAGGDWKVANLVYTVTLEATSYGSFQVTCNGETKTEGEIFENVAAGTQLTITKIKPHNDGYDQTMVYNTDKYTEFDTYEVDNQGNRTYTYTVTSDVIIAEDFRTEAVNRIFVKVPYGDALNYWKDLRIMAMNGITQYMADDPTKYAKPMNIWHDINNDYILYFFDIPAGNHSFNLYPQEDNTASDSRWYEVLPKEGTRTVNQNCWLIDNKPDNIKATGRWVSAKVTLDPCNIGTYGIIYNEVEYLNYATTSREIEMPYGSSIQIIDATPTSDHYEKNPRYETSVVKYTTDNIINSASEIKKQNGIIEIINVYGDNLKFAPNLVTKNTHRVFLHIPKDLKQIWGEVDNETNFNTIYLMDYLSSWRIALPTNPNPNFPYGRLEKMSALETFAADEDEYYYIDIPEGYHTFVFERKHKDQMKQFGQPWIKSIILHYGIPTDENNNCFTIIDETGDENRQKGTWGPLPNCTVELGWCPIGKYGVMYDGKAYYSTTAEPITSFEVPYGSELTFIEGKPVVDIYDGGIMVREPSTQRINDLTQPYRVTSDVLFDDNFVTKKEHVFYLGVPDDLIEWNQTVDKTPAEYYIWTFDQVGWFDMLEETCRGTHMPEYDGDGYKYYKFTLQPGRNEFRFEHKKPNPTGNNGNTTLARTAKLTYQVPITNENCYKLDGSYYPSEGTKYYQGTWDALPARVGDYRLLYAEKELIKEDWETVFNTVYSHPSDIIRKRDNLNQGTDIVSLHINTNQTGDRARLNPMVILQQYDGTSWVDIESHTVLPLKAEGNMAMLPGRKKAYGDLPFYSDGIDAIKNDTTFAYKGYPGSGVWNFIVKQEKDQNTPNMITTLLLDKENLKRYEGTYYIRTSNALGQWANYTYPDNHMTFSSYSLHHRNFSHYYCKWVDLAKHSSNVKFIVANDYGRAISEELVNDSYTTGDGVISENANIRWSWNIVDNKVSRAYIQGTWDTKEPPTRLDNLVAKYESQLNADPTDVTLDDTGDWIYSIDIENVKVGSKLVTLTAEYPVGSDNIQTFAKNMTMLTGNNSYDNTYVVRILYDFKIDKTLVALVPNDKQADIGIDVLIQRIDQNEATQVQANAAVRNSDGATVYAMMTFNKDKLINDKLSDQRRFTYWISFPFDVNIDDVFGFSEYGKQWRIREYDGAARAQNGYDGTQTYWKYIDINTTKVLEANKGYILVLNAKLRDPNHSAYTNRDQLSLYFPSASKIIGINDGLTQTTAVVDSKEGAAAKKDWNWNMIGVPSYANKDRTISQDHLYYFFEYNLDNDSYEVCWAGKEQTFKSMFAYMVQFAGTIDWTNFKVNSGQFPEQLAAKKDASAEINHVMRLELLRNNQREDKTYIQLTENENATEQFDMNFDLTKMANAKANLYSLIGNHQLAANVLPLQTTVVPLGVIIKTAGEYTFSMPDGTDGIIAELIDYQTNTRTNLALDNYTVTLPAGTTHTRFAISLQPDKTITGIEDSHLSTDGSQVRKFIIDGQLYMQKDGELYNAQGKLVH